MKLGFLANCFCLERRHKPELSMMLSCLLNSQNLTVFRTIFMPYWKKKPINELWIQSSSDHKTEIVEALHEALDSNADIINDALHDVSEGHHETRLGMDHQLKKQHGSDRKPRQAGGAHGWMERAAILIKLINDE